MDILQKIESDRRKEFYESVDKELDGYSIEAIKLRIQKDKRNRIIAIYLFTPLSFVSPLYFFITFSFWLAFLTSLVVAILCSCSLRTIENKIEALESGLKRKIENNKGEAL